MSSGGDGVRCPRCNRPTPGQAIGSLCVNCAQAMPGIESVATPTQADLEAPDLCGQCGYDLRGTALTGLCPECGTPIAAPAAGIGPGGVPVRRSRRGERSSRMPERVVNGVLFRGGMGLLCVALLVLFITGLASLGGVDRRSYLTTLTVIAIAVAASSWLTLPGTLDIGRRWWIVWRFSARLGLACWPVALLSMVQPWGWTVLQTEVLELIGLIGMAIYTAMLASVAVELELRDTAKRLTTATWFVIPIGIFAHYGPYPGQSINMGNTIIDGLIDSFILMTVVPWIWLVIRLMRASWEIVRFGQWAVVTTRDAQRRRDEAISRIKDPADAANEVAFDWSQDRDIPL